MGGVARKGSAQAKRAMKLASSRGISLKSAWGIVKHGGGKRRAPRKARRAARRRTRRTRTKAPRRRRTRMARHKKGGGRRRGTVLTPKKVIIAAPAVIGGVAALKQIWESYALDKDALHATTGLGYSNGKVTFDKNVAAGLLVKAGGGVVASKALKVTIQAIQKGAPMVNPLLNAKLARV